MVLTPVLGDAATTSWPCLRRCDTTLLPMRPVPPMTTIFMMAPPDGLAGVRMIDWGLEDFVALSK